MINNNIKFETDRNISYCYITYGNSPELIFSGMAICHSDDLDMQSEKTGYHIAESRAFIKLLQFKRDYEIKPVLKSLKHLKDCVYNNPNCDRDSSEYKAICKQVHNWENELIAIKEEIKNIKASLKEYINIKEKLYQRIRKDKNQ